MALATLNSPNNQVLYSKNLVTNECVIGELTCSSITGGIGVNSLTMDTVIATNKLVSDKIESNSVVYNLPVADGLPNQILSTDGSGVLSWKQDTISNVAGSLSTTTTNVDVGSSTIPTVGQALIANSASEATWQNIPAGISDNTLNVGVKTQAEVVQSVTDVQGATSADEVNNIVKRGAAGEVAIGTLTTGNIVSNSPSTRDIGGSGNLYNELYIRKILRPGGIIQIGSPVKPDSATIDFGSIAARWRSFYSTNITETLGSCTIDNAIIGATAGADIEASVVLTQGATALATADKLVLRNVGGDSFFRFAYANNVLGDTGLFYGGYLVAFSATQFQVSFGEGLFTDYLTIPALSNNVEWITQTIVPTNLLTTDSTYVSVSQIGNIVQSSTRPTPLESRTQIYLGRIDHPGPAYVITSVLNDQQVIRSPVSTTRDLYRGIGKLNVSGNEISPANSNLTIVRSAGEILAFGSNYAVDLDDPNFRTISASGGTSLTFEIRSQTGAVFYPSSNTNVVPDFYDNAGVSTNIGNDWTIQRFFMDIYGTVVCMFAQEEFGNFDQAAANIHHPFILEQKIAEDFILIGYIVLKGDCTNLQDPNKATFFNVGKFGSSVSNGGSLVNLQTAYENSLANPEILTNPTQGKLTIRRGTALDTDVQFSVQNAAGTDNFIVSGDGTAENQTGTFGMISDQRLKENIVDSKNYLHKINNVKVRSYNFKKNPDKHIGFIAQELEAVFPKLVNTRSDKSRGLDDLKSVKLTILIPILVKCIQELSNKIDVLENKPVSNTEDLTNLINAMSSKITLLEMKVSNITK
jgi:hypothetical protein